MYLVVILGFALVLVVDQMKFKSVFALTAGQSLGAVVLLIAAILAACEICTRLVVGRLRQSNRSLSRLGRFHVRCQTGIRYAIVLGFAAMLFVFNWSGTVCDPPDQSGGGGWGLGEVPLLDDLVLLLPFFLAVIASWAISYRADRALRWWGSEQIGATTAHEPRPWTLGQYLIFQIRHHLLFLAIPMSLIILANDLGMRYNSALTEITGQVWMGQALVGVAAGLVFLVMPWMMRYIWNTTPLPAGRLRTELEQLARRVGLRYRRILLWHSNGAVVNAAVTGLLAPFRYILLSDGLLENMEPEKIEAVFGHEVGHVKEHHILFYLLFTMSALVAAIGTGNLAKIWWPDQQWAADTTELLTLAILWAGIFGMLSRRFERQADVFGVRCVSGAADGPTGPGNTQGDAQQAGRSDGSGRSTAIAGESDRPVLGLAEGIPRGAANDTTSGASGHPAGPVGGRRGRNANRPPITLEGARMFGDALYKVAILNGMSPKARSWRHSSIASRGEFLLELARDPQKLAAFDRSIRWIKLALLVWSAGSVAYWAYVFRHVLPWEWVGLHRPGA